MTSGAEHDAALARAFPFHLLISPALEIVGAGSGLRRIAPDLADGARLADHFTLTQPEAPLCWELLVESPGVVFQLVHRRTGLQLSGRLQLPEADGPAIYLGTCWLTDSTQLAEFAAIPDAPPPGSPVDRDLAGAPRRPAAQISELIAREDDKDRLRRLTGELAAIFQLSPDGFVAFNEAGIRSYVNPAFVRMTGISRDELEGIDEAAFEARLALLLDPAQPPQPGPDGSEIIRLNRVRPIVLQRSRREARDSTGRLFGRILYFRDITLETEVRRANNEFLSNAAHELRTPMASIHGFTELLLHNQFPADRQRQILTTIHSQATRLVDIVNELLDVARFDARAARDLELVRQPLLPAVRTAVAELLVRGDPRPVELELPEADGPEVLLDRDKFVQALTNVLSNAYKYSPQGGAITLALRRRERDDRCWAGIAVRDRGIGMTEAQRQRLFERFFRANPAGSIPGTGLGMSMVKQIIDLHHGTIDVSSAPGEGTEVVLWLPASA